DEGGGVVVKRGFELGNPLGRRRPRLLRDRPDGFGRHHAELTPGVQRGELDLQPARELPLVRPDPGNCRSGVARDHRLDSSPGSGAPTGCSLHSTVDERTRREAVSGTMKRPATPSSKDPLRAAGPRPSANRWVALPHVPRMRWARSAAFLALSTPTAATGKPGGSCVIESRASSPSSTLLSERSGTPITGRSVCAATTPGSAAARPAPAITTRRPRCRAVRAYSATASGLRWAERTSSSWAIPLAESSSSAGCIRSRSESEPTRIPTSGASAVDMALRGGEADVGTRAHACKRDLPNGLVDGGAGLAEIVADRCHGQDPPAVRHEPVSVQRRPRVEDEGARGLGSGDSVDRRPTVALLRIVASSENDGHRSAAGRAELGAERARGSAGERLEQVALQARQDRLRLRIPEPAVELEHPRPGIGEHQP